MDIVSAVLQFGEVLWNLKGLYDQHGDNKKDMEELLSFIHNYEQQVPILRDRFKESEGNALKDVALGHLEGDIKEAIDEVGRWSSKKSFFRVFNSNQRKESITKLHTKVMASVQKALGIASLSMLMDVQASVLDTHEELKSLLISSIKSMEGLKLLEVRGEVEKARTSTFADEKFWEDILATVNKQRGAQEDMYEDSITAKLMVDPIVATNGYTYCRWTIIDNNMVKDPHNPNVALSIAVDNVEYRRRLFVNFPNQAKKFHEYRNEYRSKSLQLAKEGRLGDAALGLQHVLEWDREDKECDEVLQQVQRALREAKEECAQPLLETSNVSMLGKYDEALEDLNKAIDLEPNDELTLHQCGVVKRKLGKYEEALEDLDKANDLEPNSAFTLYEHGVVKKLLGKHGEALEDLNKANELKPNDAFTLKQRGVVKKLLEKYGEALEDLDKANDLEPNNDVTLYECGVVKIMLGKYGEALEDLNKANELKPNDAFTLKQRGVVKRMLGKYGEALEDLNKAMSLNLLMLPH